MEVLRNLAFGSIAVITVTAVIYILGCISLLVSSEVVMKALENMNY